MTVEEALIFLDAVLKEDRLNDVQQLVFCQSWEGRSYPKIAESAGYHAEYIKQVGSQLWQLLSRVFGEKVTKSNVQSVLKRQSSYGAALLTHSVSNGGKIQVLPPNAIADVGARALPFRNTYSFGNSELIGYANKHQDWGEAIDVSVFYGRQDELVTLEQWILKERCRLVALLGMGGIGKTALSIKLAEQIQDEFEYLIWRSLRNPPPIQDLLADLIQFLSNQQATALPETVDGRVTRLVDYLRQHRCLLVLDNVESILLECDSFWDSIASRTGGYREGYEGYGQLLRCLTQISHHSTVVLTSREKPRELIVQEGKTLPVRSLQLSGLPTVEAQKIFQTISSFWGLEDEWKVLIEHYAGNPLALKMVAPAIRDFFDSSVSKFLESLKQGSLLFEDIRNLLEQQFNRLSEPEKAVMYWIAINREPVSFLELEEDLVPEVTRSQLLDVLASLFRRSLIEKNSETFTQQPVVMEYMTERFIEQICEEITTYKINLFNSHALIKGQSEDYIRDSQICFTLKPIIDKLLAIFITKNRIEIQLNKIIFNLQQDSQIKPGYAGGNVLNLLCQLQTNLSHYDFSNLTVWQAYLSKVNLHHVNFQNADLAKSIFTETLSGVLSVAFSPDGKLLATGDTDGETRLWQVADGKQLFTFKEHTGWVFSVAWSPDGQTLASGSEDQTVRLWDVRSGQCLQTLQGHTSLVRSVSFSPDGQTLASGSEDQTVRLWMSTLANISKLCTVIPVLFGQWLGVRMVKP
jgi:hypothetical protein